MLYQNSSNGNEESPYLISNCFKLNRLFIRPGTDTLSISGQLKHYMVLNNPLNWG